MISRTVEQGAVPRFAKKKRAGRETCSSLAPMERWVFECGARKRENK